MVEFTRKPGQSQTTEQLGGMSGAARDAMNYERQLVGEAPVGAVNRFSLAGNSRSFNTLPNAEEGPEDQPQSELPTSLKIQKEIEALASKPEKTIDGDRQVVMLITADSVLWVRPDSKRLKPEHRAELAAEEVAERETFKPEEGAGYRPRSARYALGRYRAEESPEDTLSQTSRDPEPAAT